MIFHKSGSDATIPNDLTETSSNNADAPNALTSESATGAAIPNALTHEVISDVAVPNVLTTKTITNDGGALIGYNNLLTAATISGDSSTPSDALTPNTYQRWYPTATTVTAKFQLSVLADVDFIGIAGHNLTGVSVLIQTAVTVGGALTDVDTIVPTDNRAIM
ncbi:MAG: hypothetical protein GY814_12200, partial [Gammaproteobacteria bacterium]|nr:hypothetical protein [Gammaproteobacteria bacterium]